jgi:hypothetical protein
MPILTDRTATWWDWLMFGRDWFRCMTARRRP